MRCRYQEKQSTAFVGQMEGFLAMLEDSLMDIRGISFKGIHRSEDEIVKLFYFKFQNRPLLSRMDAVMEYLIDEYETLRGKNISEEDKEALQQAFDKMYVTKDLYKIYGWLLDECGYPPLADVEWERRILEYEDVFPMLYLKYRLKGSTKRKSIKHLVIDEMQDYSYLQYTILEEIFSCRMTILGDRAQTLDVEVQDVLTFLPKIFGKKIRKIVLNKSYRNTIEIAEYARALSGDENLELLKRHGKEVEEKRCRHVEEALAHIEKQTEEQDKEGQTAYETGAVIVMSEEEAYDVYRLLKLRGLTVNYMDRDTAAFQKGLTVTTFYLAKGLEFDRVFALLRNDGNPLYGQAKYISATRALHELYIYEIQEVPE